MPSNRKKGGFYAVKNGRKVGIYTTWAECEAQTKGFSHFNYRKFSSLREAEQFIAGSTQSIPSSSTYLARASDVKGKKRPLPTNAQDVSDCDSHGAHSNFVNASFLYPSLPSHVDQAMHTQRRRRTDTEGSSVAIPTSSSTTASPLPLAKGMKPPSVPLTLPAAWYNRVSVVPIPNVPPRNVLLKFIEIYKAALGLSSFLIRQHFKTVAARDRFAADSEVGEIPHLVASTLQVFQFDEQACTAQAREHIQKTREKYERALLKVNKAAVGYVNACHSASVDLSNEASGTSARSVALSRDLKSYAASILTEAGCKDVNLWSLYITAVVNAFADELDIIRFDIVASVHAEKDELNAGSHPAADIVAEMNGTKDIAQLVKDQISLHFATYQQKATVDESSSEEPEKKKAKVSPALTSNVKAPSSNSKPPSGNLEKGKSGKGHAKWKGKGRGWNRERSKKKN